MRCSGACWHCPRLIILPGHDAMRIVLPEHTHARRSDLYEIKFQKVDFIIFTANIKTVADQTLRRVEGRGICGGNAGNAAQRVLRYTKAVPEFNLFKKRVERNPGTLF
eukprot:4610265-Prymnesium_polylepis.1